MKWKDKRRAKRAIRGTGQKIGITSAQARAEMQEAIDAGWEASQNDPAAKARWLEMFPDGKKPSVEEFITVLGTRVQNQSKKQ